MDRAVEAFENDFARWDLHLPPDAVEARRAGHVQHAGWSVLFNFGGDGRGDYLDYYASPRDVTDDPPGDDWHVRLYESGERISLPTVLEAYMYGRDPTWEELERARRPFAGQPADSPGEVARVDAVAPEHDVGPGVSGSSAELEPNQPDRPDVAPLRETSEPPARRAVPSKDGIDLDLGGLEADASQNYLPIDIGLDIELNLPAPRGANGAAASEPAAPGDRSTANQPSEAVDGLEPAGGLAKAPERVDELEDADAVDPVGDLEPADALDAADALEPIDMPQPVDDPEPLDAAEQALPERFYVAEDSSPLVAARSEVSPLSTLPLLDVESDPDDRPAPITLGVVPEVPETRASEQTAAEPAAPQAIDTGPVEAHEEGTGPGPSIVDGADGATDSGDEKGVSSSVPTWESEFPEAAALTGPIRSRPKVFPRADIVLTADVTAIDGRFDSDSFLPWWHRPGARRVAAALAAVVVVALIAVAATHHRSRPDSEQGGADDPDSAASVAGPASASPNADSADTADSTTSAPSQSVATPSGYSSPSDSTPTPAISTQVEAPPNPMRDAADRGSEEGMARPAGPQSISPIQPSRSLRSRPTSVKSPPGSSPRAQ